jgi:drug/metabolite transporter (DMT)-like permease
MGPREWAALGLLSVIWGASFFFYRVMVTELPPMTIVFGRLAIGAAALHLFLLATGNPPRLPLRTWGRFAALGFINNVIPFTLIAYSEVRISAGVAALLIGCVPVFSAIAAQVLTRDEKMTGMRSVGVIFGLAGVGILIGKDALQGLANADFVGELVCLSAAVVYALAGIYSRTFSSLPPLKVATGSVTMGALGILPFMLAFDRPWELPLPSAPVWGSLLAIALAGTAFAYILFFRLIARVGAMNISLVTLLQPVSAALLGWLFLSEAIGANDFAGMAVIGLGLLFIDGRLPRLLFRSGKARPV